MRLDLGTLQPHGNDDRGLLEQFVVDNEDLERLESLLDQFNIFEAVGMVRQEIRHFLLDLLRSNLY
ncbi:MAG: hypothetical protein DCF17_11975 [Shackletoniella antarctica]|uniref:Uncharacterized protein n=1 Tax=Shackletoniella antarctica TaxID=268115 RepID=A0A2W4XYK8_9CYAN|nr:MAG: hypothetical protein DCF17_11975 [Shackletoniella antarctica]